MNTQMNVPPGMAMALNAQARLMAAQGQFKPVTSEGNPTVVAKNLAELSQRDAAKQAQTASGIEAMKQAQMQQALQQMLAKQSAPPVPLASGIGSLGADVQMAEGGVVGYAGPTGSFVSNLSMEEIDRMTPDMRKAYFKELLERRNAPLPTSTAPAAPPAASMRPGLGIAGAVAKKLGPLALLSELFTTSDEDVATLENARAQKEAAKYPEYSDAGRARLDAPTPPTPVVPEDTAAFMKQYANVRGQGRRGPLAEAPSPRPPAPPGDRKQPAAPADTGVASLMGPAVPSGSERQFGEAMAAQGRIEVPTERTPQQFRKQTEDYYRSLGIDPDFAKQRMSRIEAQEARDRAEAEARAKLVEGRGMENLISRLTRAGGARSGLAGLAQAQLGMEPIVAQQRAGDERFNAMMRERQIAADRERTATEDMQRALADGDIAKAEKSRNDALAARNAKNELEAKARAQYAPQLLQAETSAADRASRERENALIRATQLESARIGVSKPTAQETLRDWFKSDPKGFSAFIEAQNEPKSAAAMRKSLMEQWGKNLMLQQKFPNFEDFVTTMAPPTGGAGAGGGEFKVLSSRPK